MDFNTLSKTIHSDNVIAGWWDDPDRCLLTCVQLILTEISEATEGERKDLMDDHLPHRKMGEVELADALIRTLDLGGKIGATYRQYHIPYDHIVDRSIGAKHFIISKAAVGFGRAIEFNMAKEEVDYHYSRLIDLITAVAFHKGYDVRSAVLEKMEYNKGREDHKRENRAATGGKKF